VRRIRRVGPVNPAQRDDPHGRRRAFHHADLDGTGLAPQEQRPVAVCRAGPGRGQIKVIERVAGWMLQGNVIIKVRA
jgi:hypothetical protein